MRQRGLRSSIQLWLLVLLPSLAHILTPSYAAADYKQPIHTSDRSVEILATSPFQLLPKAGTWPLRLEIKNRSGFSRSYELSSSATAYDWRTAKYEFRAQLAVPAGSVKTFEFYLPLSNIEEDPSTTHYSQSGNLIWRLTGPGLSNGNNNLSSANTYDSTTRTYRNHSAFVVVSSAFSDLVSDIKSKVDSCGRAWNGADASPSSLPQSWVGLSGVRSLWMKDREWEPLPGEIKTAVKDWVMTGGTLHVVGEYGAVSAPEFYALSQITNESEDTTSFGLGLGTVLLNKSGLASEVTTAVAFEACGNATDTPINNISSKAYESKWRLLSQFAITSASTGLALMLFIYAVLVGPVNIFYFARHSRARLYWTTPLLAGGATLILVLFACLTDGVGGSGKRLHFAVLEPSENRVMVMQEQIAKTGVLLNRSFSLPSNVFVQQVVAQGVTTRSGSAAPGINYSYLREPAAAGGDWFRGRAAQAQAIIRVEPSRASLTLLGARDGAPSFVSSINCPLEIIFFRDGAGQLWQARHLRTGVETQFTRATEGELSEALSSPQFPAGPTLSEAVELTLKRRNYFFGRVTGNGAGKASPFALPTHSGIHWHDDITLFAGPVNAKVGAR